MLNSFKRCIIAHLSAHGIGKANAVSRHRLAAFAGCTDRVLRDTISELRIGGFPIASKKGSPGGYYIPETRQEADETINDYKHRARMMCLAAAGMTRGKMRFFPDGQQLKFTMD